jgi:uncharacterized alpha-E superfamily protein
MLLCRLAENAFWFGRYVERCEDLARAILACEEACLDMPGPRTRACQQLAGLAGVPAEAAGERAPAALLAAVVLDRESSSSVLGALNRARESLRKARPLFPVEVWHTLNALHQRLSQMAPTVSPRELRGLLEDVVSASRELSGHIKGGMLRDDAYVFHRMGVHIERADMMLRIAVAVTETLIPARERTLFADVGWIGLLKAVGAYSTYRHRYHARSSFKDALELFLGDAEFPRSLGHSLREIGRDLVQLPANGAVLAAIKECRPQRAMETRADLEAFAAEELASLARLSAAVEATYFSPRSTPPRGRAAPLTARPRPTSIGELETQAS